MYQLSSKGLVRTSREGSVELDVKASGRGDGLGFWDTSDWSKSAGLETQSSSRGQS